MLNYDQRDVCIDIKSKIGKFNSRFPKIFLHLTIKQVYSKVKL